MDERREDGKQMKVWVVIYVYHGVCDDVWVFADYEVAEQMQRELLEDPDYDDESDDVVVFEATVQEKT